MMRLVDALMPNGDVTYVGSVDAVPATSETQGNVTVNNMGSPGSPAYFEVSFRLNATYENESIQTTVYMTPSVIVLNKTKDSTFREVEAEAARDVASMLRALADKVEHAVAEYDAKHVDKSVA